MGMKQSTQKPLRPAIPVVSDKDRAILELKNSRDKLKKYRKKLDIEAGKLQEQALTLIRAKQKDRALLILKLRKHKELAVESVDNQLLSILRMIEDVEWQSVNIEVLKALKTGTAALNKMHDEMSVDDITAILDDTNEAIEVENEINRLLAGQFSPEDDEALMDELNSLGTVTAENSIDSNNRQGSATLQLPEVPTSPIILEQRQEDEQAMHSTVAAAAAPTLLPA